MLTSASTAFVERVRWEDGVAVGWRPHNEPNSPVEMVSDQRFGKPMVKRISTEVLWEHEDAGEDIAEDFGLRVTDVRWALSYENALRAA